MFAGRTSHVECGSVAPHGGETHRELLGGPHTLDARWGPQLRLNYDAELTLMATQLFGMLTQLVKASGDQMRGLDSLILKARLSATLAVELRSDPLVLGVVDCRIAPI